MTGAGRWRWAASLGTAPEATRWNGNQLFIVAADPPLNDVWARLWNPSTGWPGWTAFQASGHDGRAPRARSLSAPRRVP